MLKSAVIRAHSHLRAYLRAAGAHQFIPFKAPSYEPGDVLSIVIYHDKGLHDYKFHDDRFVMQPNAAAEAALRAKYAQYFMVEEEAWIN